MIALHAQSFTKQKVKKDWTKANIQGKVKSYTELSYEAVERFGKIEKGKRYIPILGNRQINYNENGNQTEKNDSK